LWQQLRVLLLGWRHAAGLLLLAHDVLQQQQVLLLVCPQHQAAQDELPPTPV
jgi:hypothetical protein